MDCVWGGHRVLVMAHARVGKHHANATSIRHATIWTSAQGVMA